MNSLEHFIQILSGHFDNTQQLEEMKKAGKDDFPFAEHVNTPCNDKILDLPDYFEGVFLVEESYYTTGGKTHASPHLFLFTPKGENIKLTSYELPQGIDKSTFSYDSMTQVRYSDLKASAKFTPAVYTLKDGAWEGGSTSMFTPVLKFTLWERFSPEQLEVSESMEMNGKRTFGYDVPIVYRRK